MDWLGRLYETSVEEIRILMLSRKTANLYRIANNYVIAIMLCLGMCLVIWSGCNRSLAADVAVIRIKYRWATEVRPIVQSMLSSEGTVTVSERINSLIIVDSQESIQRVRAYLDQFDKPLEQVGIHVRFYENREVSGNAVSTRGKVSGDNLSAAVGVRKNDRVDLSMAERHRNQLNYEEFLVFATTGQPAFIQAGKEIPYKGRWPDYTRRFSTGGATVMFQSVETGFEVTPTTAGDLVHLRIVPRIAYGDAKEAVVRLYGAQIEVTTSYGQWVEIGGTNSQSNEVIKEILARGSKGKPSSLSMSLMVEQP